MTYIYILFPLLVTLLARQTVSPSVPTDNTRLIRDNRSADTSVISTAALSRPPAFELKSYQRAELSCTLLSHPLFYPQLLREEETLFFSFLTICTLNVHVGRFRVHGDDPHTACVKQLTDVK